MKIIDVIKDEDGPLLRYGERWLEWSGTNEAWLIYERGYRKKKTVLVFETQNEEQAIECLMGN